MTTCYNLPVYKESYDLLLEIFKVTKEFQREYKYTIGESIKKETIDMLINIYRANAGKKRVEHIEEARENIEVIRLLLRLLKDLRQINLRKFVQLNEKVENLSRQLTGWQKSSHLQKFNNGERSEK